MIDGYVILACAILEAQREAYEFALRSWARRGDWIEHDARVERIEKELLTEYYARLTFSKVNFKKYINDMRHKYGLPQKV